MPIRINGVIIDNGDKWIYDWFGIDATSPKDVIAALDDAKGKNVDVEISSSGGSVWAGSDIYSALKSHKGKVTTIVTSVAASAASIIAMAGDIVKIAPTAQIMIHNVSNVATGDYRDMAHMSEVLENYNKNVGQCLSTKDWTD